MKYKVVMGILFFVPLYSWQPRKNTLFSLNANADFGKKHFIIGYTPEKQSIKRKKTNEPTAQDTNVPIKKVLFAPNDDVRSTLLNLIAQEQKHISIAMFAFTDKDFAQALTQAQLRGVPVEIIIDPSNIYGRYNKLADLQKGHVSVFVYNPTRFNKKVPGAMHNKFVIFEKNRNNKPLVWTGSFNFTRAAHQRNQENVVLLDDPDMVQKYINRFQELKKYADVYHAPNAAQIQK